MSRFAVSPYADATAAPARSWLSRGYDEPPTGDGSGVYEEGEQFVVVAPGASASGEGETWAAVSPRAAERGGCRQFDPSLAKYAFTDLTKSVDDLRGYLAGKGENLDALAAAAAGSVAGPLPPSGVPRELSDDDLTPFTADEPTGLPF